MVKFHWQIYRALLSELSKMCSCKWKTLTKWFDKLARCRRGKVTNYLLVCCIWQRWGIQLIPSARYTRSSKQTLCVGPANKMAKQKLRSACIAHRIDTELFTGLKFSHQIFNDVAAISLLSICQVSLLLIYFLQRSTNLTKIYKSDCFVPYHWYTGTSGNFNICWKTKNSVSSHCANGKSSTAQKPQVHSKVFKW